MRQKGLGALVILWVFINKKIVDGFCFSFLGIGFFMGEVSDYEMNFEFHTGEGRLTVMKFGRRTEPW